MGKYCFKILILVFPKLHKLRNVNSMQAQIQRKLTQMAQVTTNTILDSELSALRTLIANSSHRKLKAHYKLIPNQRK